MTETIGMSIETETQRPRKPSAWEKEQRLHEMAAATAAARLQERERYGGSRLVRVACQACGHRGFISSSIPEKFPVTCSRCGATAIFSDVVER
jgi:ribosomal protein S27E